jgi:hypothetical protein|tara:strand:- start:38 stop:532 length:495 start_codon:yes stop_codon:yes gene_type:complete
MKNFFKYSLYGLIYLLIIFVLAVIFLQKADADTIKPNNKIDPYQVVKIQLKSLKNNNEPKKDSGIEQTWEFAHPSNKKYTGPLPRFVDMLKSGNYKMLLDHKEHRVTEIFSNDIQYGFEVKILGKDKNYYKFQWVVEKYFEEGVLKDCWLTTSVSSPISLGSSI